MRRYFIAVSIGLGLTCAGCDETLPPRNDPLAIVRGGFVMDEGIVVIRDSLPLSGEGWFEGWIENTFTEVLQDSQRLLMTVDVELKADPAQKAHIVADRFFVLEPQYVTSTILTLEPGKPVHIHRQWSHRTDGGTWFWAFSEHLYHLSTPNGEPYLESDPMTFTVRAMVQGFARVGALHFGPRDYTLTYRIF